MQDDTGEIIINEPMSVVFRKENHTHASQILQADRGRLYPCEQDSSQAHAGGTGVDTPSSVSPDCTQAVQVLIAIDR